MRRLSLWVATVIVGVALSPCGDRDAVAPDGIFFPTVPIGDSYPAGLMEGALQVDDGCVYVVMGDERWLVLWPEGFRATFDGGRLAVHDEDGVLVGRDGGPVRLGGGEINPVDVDGAAAHVRDLTGEIVPERCGELFWLASPG